MASKITFLGGAQTVTGSRFLLETHRKKVLVDCGLYQGVKELRRLNWNEFPVDPHFIDAVILTHAHLDHSGYLPLLVKKGFRGKVFCTHPTRALSRIILSDFAHLQEEDAEMANREGYSKHAPARPLYQQKDVERALAHFTPVGLRSWTTIAPGIRFRFSNNGHILGSVFVEVDFDKTRIVFSGDLGREVPLLLNPPEPLRKATYVVIESTYGDRIHRPLKPEVELARVVNETASRKGHLVIASFAVGRTQDLLYLFSRLKRSHKIPDLPIFLDTPMGINATEVFRDFSEWHRLSESEVKHMMGAVRLVRSHAESMDLARSRKPSVIIAGSGMVSGGRVLNHLEHILPEKRHTILLVGYQAPGTRGRQLLHGAPELKIHGRYIPVRCHVEMIDVLSAHADQTELVNWLEGVQGHPLRTFLVHGEPEASDGLRLKIRDLLGWDVTIPKLGESFKLA